MSADRKDLGAGLVFVVVGTFISSMRCGRCRWAAVEMGPGYFPIVLSSLVAPVGVVVMVAQLLRRTGYCVRPLFPWRRSSCCRSRLRSSARS